MKTKFWLSVVICIALCFSFPHVAIGQNLTSSLFDKALYESKEGNLSDALDSWNEFLLSYPEDPIALSNRGNIRFALGDAEGAIRDQTRSIELLPLETDSHLNRAVAEEFLGQWDLAKLDYQWVLQREPDNSSALNNLGNVMGAQNDWVQSKLLFNQAFTSNPEFIVARSNKALACYQLKQFDEAEKELRSIIRKYPLFADARAAMSALLWRQGLSGEAESHWAAAVGLDNRYQEEDWLVNIRRWPPDVIYDLMAFLKLENI